MDLFPMWRVHQGVLSLEFNVLGEVPQPKSTKKVGFSSEETSSPFTL